MELEMEREGQAKEILDRFSLYDQISHWEGELDHWEGQSVAPNTDRSIGSTTRSHPRQYRITNRKSSQPQLPTTIASTASTPSTIIHPATVPSATKTALILTKIHF